MRWWLGSVLLFATACGGGLERVSFVTDRLEYNQTDRVMLSLTNVGGTAVRVRLCAAELQYASGTSPFDDDRREPCPETAALVHPGERVLERRFLDLVLIGSPMPFRYRAAIQLPSDNWETVVTPVFSVKPATTD
jgi:hypothetical protein